MEAGDRTGSRMREVESGDGTGRWKRRWKQEAEAGDGSGR
jgi:hypothetical protein